MKLSLELQIIIVGVISAIVIVVSGYVLFFMDDSTNPKTSQKCYGSECKNPYLSNEIVGADFSREYVVLELQNGTRITTDCLASNYDVTQNATSWYCNDKYHTIIYQIRK